MQTKHLLPSHQKTLLALLFALPPSAYFFQSDYSQAIHKKTYWGSINCIIVYKSHLCYQEKQGKEESDMYPKENPNQP